jgi:hypothetical protein
MKRQVFPVLILLVVLLLPVLTGCPQDAGDAISSGHYGDDLPVFEGKVYTQTMDLMTDKVSYDPVTDSGIVQAWDRVKKLAEGSLADGSFTISITAKPDSNTLSNIGSYWVFSNWGGSKVTIDKPEAQFTSLGLYVYEEGTYTGSIFKEKITITFPENNTVDRKYDNVYYLYVDRDVTVTLGEGKDSNDWWDFTYEASELKFLKGWNALYTEMHEIFADDRRHTETLSVEDPKDLYWVFSPPYEEEE